MKYYFLIAINLFFINILNAQDCLFKFSGVVEDYHEKTPIENATVFIRELNRYTVTDSKGRFSIRKLCEGKVSVEIAHLGCKTQVLELYIDNTNIYKIVNLEHHELDLEEVLISSKVQKKRTSTQVKTLGVSTLEKYASLSLGDALKEVSGVSSLNSGNNIVKPIINGLHSSRVLVISNNVKLQDQDWGIEHAPNIDMSQASNITVIKGASALEYGGDAIGGVVIVNPDRVIIKDTLYGKTIVNQQANPLGISFNTKLNASLKQGWFTNASASLKRFGDAKAKNYYLTNSGLNTKAFSINSGFKNFKGGFEVYYSYLNNEIAILSTSHLGNITDLVNAINSPEPIIKDDFSFDIKYPKQNVKHQIFKGLFYKRFKGLGKFNFQYDYQHNHRLEYDKRKGKLKDIPAVDLLLQTHSISSNFTFDSDKTQIFKVGFLGSYQNNYANPNTKVKRLIPDYKKYDLGLYAVSNLKFDDFSLDTGIRYDLNYYNAYKYYFTSVWKKLGYNKDFKHFKIKKLNHQFLTHPKFTFHNFSISAGGTYNFNEYKDIAFNYSMAKRSPNASELFSDGLHHSASRFEIGDLHILPETSHRIGLTYNFTNNKFLANLEGFYNYIKDFIYIQPSGVEKTNRGAFPTYNYKQTNANILGIDTNISYKINNHWSLNNKSSFIYGQNLTNNTPLVDIPPINFTNGIEYKNKKWMNLTSKLESRFVYKQYRYPNNNFKAYIPTTNTYSLVDVSSTPKPYHLLNFSTDVNLKLSKTELGIGVSVNNIFNTSYRDYLDRFKYYTDEVGRNISLQLKITY